LRRGRWKELKQKQLKNFYCNAHSAASLTKLESVRIKDFYVFALPIFIRAGFFKTPPKQRILRLKRDETQLFIILLARSPCSARVFGGRRGDCSNKLLGKPFTPRNLIIYVCFHYSFSIALALAMNCEP
jgi:hypothetical protein